MLNTWFFLVCRSLYWCQYRTGSTVVPGRVFNLGVCGHRWFRAVSVILFVAAFILALLKLRPVLMQRFKLLNASWHPSERHHQIKFSRLSFQSMDSSVVLNTHLLQQFCHRCRYVRAWHPPRTAALSSKTEQPLRICGRGHVEDIKLHRGCGYLLGITAGSS